MKGKDMRTILVAALVAAVVAFAVGMWTGQGAQGVAAPHKETAYERVMRTGVLRCGYLAWPPSVIQDPKTGELTGIVPDYFEEVGKATGLKIEWSTEINLATYLEDMKNGRYDAECSGGWSNALRGKMAEYTDPIGFFPVVAWVRADDTRFDADISRMNSEDVRIALIDGESANLIRERRFPKSQLIPLSQQMLDVYFEQVASGKADVVFNDIGSGMAYMKANPGKIKYLKQPMRVIEINASVAKGEHDLLGLLNTATKELMYDGVVDAIMDKYDPERAQFYRVRSNYRLPE
ncbi:MAG: transporter substrate-binding domain-containing protein [Pseudomonadaceae bacterium]|nr:transporter substrate-binding domain-containing protein [Pseudomonadaceae bacterium]